MTPLSVAGCTVQPGRRAVAEPAGLRIAPFEPHQLDAVVGLSLRAWAPVFATLHRAMPPAILRAFYPQGWEVRQRAAVEAGAGDDGHAPARRTDAGAGFALWPVARYFREL